MTDILVFAIGLIGMLYGVWFVAIAVLGNIKKYSPPEPAEPKARFAVLIPARNEENVVGHLVKSLMAQDYPRELFDVIVIPNNCSDGTAAAAEAAGAQVLECTVPVTSKGGVLRFAFAELAGKGYDAYCILDADNLVAPGFLRAANSGLQAGCEVCQGYRDSKNPRDNWVAGDTSIFFWMMNRFYYRARNALGLSAALNGTGIVLKSSLVNRLGWDMVSLTEDLEFTGLCAVKNVHIAFLQDAVIYDEQPLGIIDSIVQRRRWFKGGMQCFRIHAKGLLKRHSMQAIDVFIVFSGWLAMIMGGISGAMTVWRVLCALYTGALSFRMLALIAVGAALLAVAACAFAAWLVCAMEKKLDKVRFSAIIMFPVFLVTWFIANLWALVTPAPKWTQIAHTRGTDTPD